MVDASGNNIITGGAIVYLTVCDYCERGFSGNNYNCDIQTPAGNLVLTSSGKNLLTHSGVVSINQAIKRKMVEKYLYTVKSISQDCGSGKFFQGHRIIGRNLSGSTFPKCFPYGVLFQRHIDTLAINSFTILKTLLNASAISCHQLQQHINSITFLTIMEE